MDLDPYQAATIPMHDSVVISYDNLRKSFDDIAVEFHGILCGLWIKPVLQPVA